MTARAAAGACPLAAARCKALTSPVRSHRRRIRRPARFADGGARRFPIFARSEAAGCQGPREQRRLFSHHFGCGPRQPAIFGSLAIPASARVRCRRSRALPLRARPARAVYGGFDASAGDPRESPVCARMRISALAWTHLSIGMHSTCVWEYGGRSVHDIQPVSEPGHLNVTKESV